MDTAGIERVLLNIPIAQRQVADISGVPGTNNIGPSKIDLEYGDAVMSKLTDVKRSLYQAWSSDIASYTKTATHIALNGADRYFYIGGKVNIIV